MNHEVNRDYIMEVCVREFVNVSPLVTLVNVQTLGTRDSRDLGDDDISGSQGEGQKVKVEMENDADSASKCVI